MKPVLLIHEWKKKALQVNWQLLVFMLLVLNVKLPLKVAAVLIITILNRKMISPRDFFRQRYLFFYFGLIAIGLVNLLLQYKHINTAYLVTAAVGISFWLMSAAIAYHIYTIIQKEETARIHYTVGVFFILNISAIFLNFLCIIFETGSINPYTYKGLNQKYFISTGDLVTGITFDSPVTTALICAFGLLYFFYRRRYILSIASMAALLIMASNFTNFILVAVLVFAFVFNSSRLQKSFIVIYIIMLVVFIAKISPDNYEHVGRFFYQVINKPYDLPAKIAIPREQLKKEPDSVLNFEQRRQKLAQNYIDSVSAAKRGPDYGAPKNILEEITAVHSKAAIDSMIVPNSRTTDNPNGKKWDRGFYQFRQSREVLEKINQDKKFLENMYSPGTRDSLGRSYNWNMPGKWIAGKQLVNFFKDHPSRVLLGNGIGNFSSRIAFKATILNIAGRYPEKFKYINADFLENHLYVYLYYHSQDQSKHEASNTPDTVYFQVMGEYGVIGMFCLFFLYFGFFIRRIRKMSYGLPLLFLLAGAFFAEYWFEQFSIVVLFELLLFLDMKDLRRGEQKV